MVIIPNINTGPIVIETNTGETVGKEGKTLDDATITGGIDWYFKTVEVVE